MKIRFIITTVFINLCLFAFGQNNNNKTQKLNSVSLLTQEDVSSFKRILSSSKNSSYILALYQTEFKKLTGQYPILGHFLNFSKKNIHEKKQKKINHQLLNYLSRLLDAELIQKEHYSLYKARIDQNKYLHILQLLHELYAQVEQEEFFSPHKVVKFADSLKAKNICTNKNYSRLLEYVHKKDITNSIDFLNYCDKSIIIELDKYSDNPEEYLEAIHRKTATLLPTLKFDTFKYEIVLDKNNSSWNYKSYNLMVSISFQGREYIHSSFISLDYKEKYEGTMTYFGKIGPSYYKIFNKILADIQSEYRLHYVNKIQNNIADYGSFGIIALTKQQASYLHGGGVYFTTSYESFKNNITTEKINVAIKSYQEIGLFKHLSKEEIENSTKKVYLQENKNFNSVLLCFPKIIHWFDMELENLENPYAELVRRYAEISHMDFKPQEITDDFNIELNEYATLSFKLNNKSYVQKLKIKSDWIDGTFFNFIDNVVKENNLHGKFYSLYEGGQGALIIYLTPEQYRFMRENKIAVFDDEWESQEE